MHHLDLLWVDADLVGNDLRQRGAQSLSMRGGADPRLDETGGVDGEVHRLPARRDLHAARGERRASVAGALGKGGKTDPEIAALLACLLLPLAKRGEIDGLDRQLHG